MSQKGSKPGKRGSWHCLYCHDPLPIKDNCRKAECIEKHQAVERRMGVNHGK